MTYTTIASAIEALEKDQSWQISLTDEERYVCLKMADLKFHQAMDAALGEIKARLMLVSRLIKQCEPEKRELYIRALIE